MKALSVRQPYAYLILKGIKRIENRTWSTNYRGPLAIHASLRWHDRSIDEIEATHRLCIPRELPLGGIIGVIDLVDVIEQSNDPFFEGPFGFVLRNPRPLPFRQMPGRLHLFDVKV
jgi:hypothetical protein